jgi:hypothetical protein
MLLAGGCREEQQDAKWMQSEFASQQVQQVPLCHDGLDNDQDGLTDCVDPDCAEVCVEGTADDLATCRDGVDNDMDGQSDCADDQCKANQGCCPPAEERSFETSEDACLDMLDNDCNGYVDCDDKSCWALAFCEGTDATCADGEDNDGDGFTDCKDYSCSKNSGVTVCQPGTGQ